jgi:hypothetical protein
MTTQSRLDIDWPVLIHRLVDLALSYSDDILNSPAKLGELLSICAEFAEIEPIVRERATTLAMQKKEVVGWSLVHRDGHRYVEAQRIIELCLHCPLATLQSLLTTLVMQLGNVSETKYQLLCESAGVAPDSAAVQQTGATIFLRRDPKVNNIEM